ncbi:interleukin-9 receptor isoform X1 [Globicephala melas]|uniref:interleukin-9 receptor isoform X1 n=1 Tax=Globicephala melas TaxID=9731 RepID=UPI00293D36D8|nr:interleukin-9 receptor isoform X1 [Globicephala melas]XP_060140493.1 interleukin-9 receptor isoform X1 [Globicephala melas]
MREVGTWLLTCTCICAWVGLGVSVPGDRGGPGTFTCHTNNILRIDCHWSAPELGQGAGPWLLFTSNHAPGSKHRCVFRASVCTVELPPEEVLVPSDNFTITFHRHVSGKEQVSLVDPQYLPRRHVKLDPPSDLLSNITSNHCVLTWSINPALEPLASLLSYELAFKRQEETWERARHKDHIVGVTWLKLEATELDPGSTYEARLRVQMATPEDAVAEEERYEGPWSDWSQPTRFHSPQRQEVLERISDPGDLMDGKGKAQGCVIHPEYSRRRDINLPFWPEAPIQVLLPGEFGGTQPWALPAIGLLVPALGQRDSTLVSVSIFLLLTSLTYLLFKLSPRMKTALYQDVPSPGPFFQSLYSVHNGDFQTWIGAHRAGPEPSPDCTGPARGAWETRVREAIALLTYDPVDVGPLAGLEEEGSTGTGLPADALPAGCVEEGGPLPAYLPQEAWAPAGPTRLAPPQSQGSSSDYCALGCSRWGCPSTFTGSAQSSEPDAALACGPFCDQQSLDARPGGNCAGVGHSQRQDAGGWAA